MNKPVVSALTSFDIEYFRSSQKVSLNGLFSHAEVYAFMHGCLEHLFGTAIVPPGDSVLRVLARTMRGDPSAPSRVASSIHTHFADLQITAFSTFLPEITAPENLPAWKDAQDALKFLILTIHELREKYGHPCRTLEFVSGSRVDGMWKGEDLANDEVYVLNRLTGEDAIKRLLDRLIPIATLAAEKNVNLALEMEPGPLFVVGDWPSLLSLCNILELRNDDLKHTLGLNLDIAHWAFLAGVTPAMVRKNPCVMDRIVHAHVSDHNRGHCSDAIPTMFHSAAEFLPWFDLLVELMNRPPTGKKLSYSGFISCELEAAYNLKSVVFSKDIIEHWISSSC